MLFLDVLLHWSHGTGILKEIVENLGDVDDQCGVIEVLVLLRAEVELGLEGVLEGSNCGTVS